MSRPLVIVLTSTFLRHRFLVNHVSSQLDVVGVWQEEKSFKPERYAQTDEDHTVIAEHFAARDESESGCFSADEQLRIRPSVPHRVGPSGFINDLAEIDRMRGTEPDVVLVFGTGLLKEALIARFEGRIINLHLGLSPYYRGSGTNFWPLVNREPELVGATVHYLDAGIDTGPILAHVRPAMSVADGPHDVGNRAIVAGAHALMAAARAHVEGRVTATPQMGRGRLYQRKDFSAEAIGTLRRNFETGMIREYLSHKAERDARLDLVSLAEDA